MKNKLMSGLSVVAASIAWQSVAIADCGGASVSEVKRAYTSAQQLEAQGKKEEALFAFVAAQEPTCEANPIESDAAKRAAALAPSLALSAEQRGDHAHAFRLYDAGGYFAKADYALMMQLRAEPDNPQLFEQVRAHFDNRALASFQSNNALRLKITGSYQVSPKLVAELLTLPAIGIERALQRDATLFDEAYLRDRVQLVQNQPEVAINPSGIQNAVHAQQVFASKWPTDLLQADRTTLRTLKAWAVVTRDTDLVQRAERSYTQRVESHLTTLRQKYDGDPRFLEAAMDYAHMLDTGDSAHTARIATTIAQIRSQAEKLGDAALAKQRFALAIDYFGVADTASKAEAARAKQREIAMAKIQPSIDTLQRQATALQAQYSDPEKVRALQAQAEALRTNLQQQQSKSHAEKKKGAADLEKELGL